MRIHFKLGMLCGLVAKCRTRKAEKKCDRGGALG